MLEFESILIFTGLEKRVSKQGKEYVILNYLNPSGHSFGTMSDVDNLIDLKQLDKVKVRFGLTTGKYTQLKTLSIVKV